MSSIDRRVSSSDLADVANHRTLARRSLLAKGLASALVAEQVLVVAVGGLGSLRVEFSSLLLRAFILGLILIDVVIAARLLPLGGPRIRAPRLFVWAGLGLLLAAVAKNAGTAPLLASATDLFRLANILLWMFLMATPGVAGALEPAILRHKRTLTLLLASQFVLLLLARARGWGGAYLSGDPLVGVLMYPLLLRRSSRWDALAITCVASGLVVLSLKRTAWLSASIAVVVFVAWSIRHLRLTRLIQLVGALAFLFLVIATSGWGEVVVSRLRRATLTTSRVVEAGGADASLARRNDEVAVQLNRLAASPVDGVTLGLSSSTQELASGATTHAIHNTFVFLLASGGVLWIAAVAAARPRIPEGVSMPLAVGALVTLVDAAGGNSALTPSLGIAFGVLAAQTTVWWRRVFR